MLLAYAGTGIFLSDGCDQRACRSPPHAGTSLHRDAARREPRRRAPRLAARRTGTSATRSRAASTRAGICTRRSSRCATRPATRSSSRASRAAAERLRNFIEKAAQATLVGDVFDDAATGQGLLNYFLRALNSGAIDVGDLARTGLTPEEVELRSFAKILAARRARLGAG